MLPDGGSVGPRNVWELVFYNITIISIKLRAFAGLNCENLIIKHGKENVKSTEDISSVLSIFVFSI